MKLGRIDITLTYILTYVKQLELVDLSVVSRSRHWFISSLRYIQSTQGSKRCRIWQQLGGFFLVYIDDITIQATTPDRRENLVARRNGQIGLLFQQLGILASSP